MPRLSQSAKRADARAGRGPPDNPSKVDRGSRSRSGQPERRAAESRASTLEAVGILRCAQREGTFEGLGPPAWLAELFAHAEGDHPREACGLVLAAPGLAPRAVRLPNSSSRPVECFEVAAEPLLVELARADARGERLLVLYHSHASRSPDLSAEDVRAVVEGGRPLWPGVAMGVIAMERGRAVGAQAHVWREGCYEPVDWDSLCGDWSRELTTPPDPDEGAAGLDSPRRRTRRGSA